MHFVCCRIGVMFAVGPLLQKERCPQLFFTWLLPALLVSNVRTFQKGAGVVTAVHFLATNHIQLQRHKHGRETCCCCVCLSRVSICYTWTSYNGAIWLVRYLGKLGISHDWDLKLGILRDGRLVTLIKTKKPPIKTNKSAPKSVILFIFRSVHL